jgi:hypothetical protein
MLASIWPINPAMQHAPSFMPIFGQLCRIFGRKLFYIVSRTPSFIGRRSPT